MERFLAWYRVGSSYGAVAALLIANSIPLIGVLFLGWNVWTILTIYWLENGVVGVFNVLKMARADGPVLGGIAPMSLMRNGVPITGTAKAVMIPFFILHYGIFWLVHGVFILALPSFIALRPDSVFGGGGLGGFGDGGLPDASPGIASDPRALALVVLGLFISHGVSYWLNYIRRGEYKRTSIARQMAAPYARLFILHVTIILGAMAIAITGAPAAAVLVLVVLKTALDLALHLAEHRTPPLIAAAVDAPEPAASRPGV